MMYCFTTDPEATEPSDHGSKHEKLSQISLFLLKKKE
jgi:hypothetical protein